MPGHGTIVNEFTEFWTPGALCRAWVGRVSDINSQDDLSEIGRDIEAVELNHALRWHAEHRVLLNGNKTVVFSR